ncbi:MAG: hypothetical protein GTO40_26280 [Deltaproteobacteria bacterium]|nr:hypothetical protein [Deltaproteobacteria bacterium]
MSKNVQRGPFASIVRAIYLLIQGRIHFPKDRLGTIVGAGEDFETFRNMTLDPGKDQPEKPGAIFKVRFQFASMSPEMNIRTSLIPIPFIVAQPGFRSKMWALGRESGEFQGIYEWDTVASAENYWTSFPMNLMKSRAVPETLSYEIEGIEFDKT